MKKILALWSSKIHKYESLTGEEKIHFDEKHQNNCRSRRKLSLGIRILKTCWATKTKINWRHTSKRWAKQWNLKRVKSTQNSRRTSCQKRLDLWNKQACI